MSVRRIADHDQDLGTKKVVKGDVVVAGSVSPDDQDHDPGKGKEEHHLQGLEVVDDLLGNRRLQSQKNPRLNPILLRKKGMREPFL